MTRLERMTHDTLSRQAAVDLARDVLVQARTSAENAMIVAEALVAAELDGIGSHGLARLLSYAEQAEAGKIDGFALPELSRPAAAVVRVDARDGFAFPAIRKGLAAIEERLDECGIVALAIAHSHHCGVAGHHVEHLARRGHVAMMFANSPAAMAPAGGRIPSFGTNPIAFAAPTSGDPASGDPVVVDLSLSRIARGRIVVAEQRGEAIPEGWALDRDGRPTTDAGAALAGTMVPLGGAKGAALALMVEILSATLTGSNHAFEASSFLDAKSGPPRVGQLILAIAPKAFGPNFAERIEVLLAHAYGQEGTRRPGSRRFALRRRHLAEGIAIDGALHQRIRERLARAPSA